MKPEKYILGRNVRNASCMASDWELALLEMRIPSDSDTKMYGKERNASNSTLPWMGTRKALHIITRIRQSSKKGLFVVSSAPTRQ
jgi:hypothetical protein